MGRIGRNRPRGTSHLLSSLLLLLLLVTIGITSATASSESDSSSPSNNESRSRSYGRSRGRQSVIPSIGSHQREAAVSQSDSSHTTSTSGHDRHSVATNIGIETRVHAATASYSHDDVDVDRSRIGEHQNDPFEHHIPHRRSGAPTSDQLAIDERTDCALRRMAVNFAKQIQGRMQPAATKAVKEALEVDARCAEVEPVREGDVNVVKGRSRSNPMNSGDAENRDYSSFLPTQLKWRTHTGIEEVEAVKSRLSQNLKDRLREMASAHSVAAKKSGHVEGKKLNNDSGNNNDIDNDNATHPITLFVDANHGSDKQDGGQNSPLRSLSAALRLLRSLRPTDGSRRELARYPATIYLRQGMYFFPRGPVRLDTLDSYVTIAAYREEEVVFSGGVDLSAFRWRRWSRNKKVLVAHLPRHVCSTHSCFNELYVNGRRAIRARFPNANPETQGLWTIDHTGYIDDAAMWLPYRISEPALNVTMLVPRRPSPHFPFYQVGVGGPASVFDPPRSFWANQICPAGVTYAVPSGLQWHEKDWTNRTYSNPRTALVHAYHGWYWGNWIFEVSSIDPLTRTIQFGRGGFQEARGMGNGRQWYIENLLEELDQENEWWLDEMERKIYFCPNQTQMDIRENEDGTVRLGSGKMGGIVATQTDCVLDIRGNTDDGNREDELVDGLILRGITFAHTSSTFMRSMEVPSGGDWTIIRRAAIQMQGVQNSLLLENVFNGMGGNALLLSGAAFNVSIVGNEMVWVGSSAILLAGYTDGMDGYSRKQQPTGTFIFGNMMHELGVWVKQSSAVGMSISRETTIDSNICFNLARACININDGFGGGHEIQRNLLFNAVRETDDHGAINSWDRQPYIWADEQQPTMHPRLSFIHKNFIINNYHAVWPIDHDDGSQHFVDTSNFLVYGGFKTYLGNNLLSAGNLYVLPDAKAGTDADTYGVRRDAMMDDHERTEKGDDCEQRFKGLTTIMQHRAENLHHRYVTLPQRLKAREQQGGVEVNNHLSSDPESLHRNWGQYCVQTGMGPGHVWVNNTCTVLDSSNIYNLWECSLSNMATTVPFLMGNDLHAPSPEQFKIQCGLLQPFSMQQWQAMGHDLFSSIQQPMALGQIQRWGKQLLALEDEQDQEEKAENGPEIRELAAIPGSATTPAHDRTKPHDGDSGSMLIDLSDETIFGEEVMKFATTSATIPHRTPLSSSSKFIPSPEAEALTANE